MISTRSSQCNFLNDLTSCSQPRNGQYSFLMKSNHFSVKHNDSFGWAEAARDLKTRNESMRDRLTSNLSKEFSFMSNIPRRPLDMFDLRTSGQIRRQRVS